MKGQAPRPRALVPYLTACSHLTEAESGPLYERYAIPSVAHVLWQGALAALKTTGDSHVEFEKATRAPLLLGAGSKDNVVPHSTVEKEFAAYKKGGDQPVVELKLWEGRTHGIVNQAGWQEVAEFVLAFAERERKK